MHVSKELDLRSFLIGYPNHSGICKKVDPSFWEKLADWILEGLSGCLSIRRQRCATQVCLEKPALSQACRGIGLHNSGGVAVVAGAGAAAAGGVMSGTGFLTPV